MFQSISDGCPEIFQDAGKLTKEILKKNFGVEFNNLQIKKSF
jgi:hypothetical protein